MKKRIFLPLLFIILIVFLTGCWNSRELNELGISLLIALDIEDDKVLLTAEIVDIHNIQESSGFEDSEGSIKYVQGIGNNILEAFRDLVLKFDRRIFASHNKVIIIGEELAKKGILSHIDELLRDREQRLSAYILIAKGSKAYEVLGVNNGLEEIPANYIFELVENVKDNPKTIDVNMVKYLKYYYKDGHHPITGVIEKIEKSKICSVEKESERKSYELSVIGSAVFDEDVLVGYLNGNDTKSLNFIMDNIKGGIITFPTPKSAVGLEGEFKSVHKDLSSMIIIKNKIKNDIEVRDGNIILKTKITLRGGLQEVVGSIDVSKQENLNEMETACSKAVEEGIKSAVKKAQEEFELDIFGFGSIFHRKYPEEWNKIEKDWDMNFSKADFEVEVETNMIRTGLINTSVIKKKEK